MTNVDGRTTTALYFVVRCPIFSQAFSFLLRARWIFLCFSWNCVLAVNRSYLRPFCVADSRALLSLARRKCASASKGFPCTVRIERKLRSSSAGEAWVGASCAVIFIPCAFPHSTHHSQIQCAHYPLFKRSWGVLLKHSPVGLSWAIARGSFVFPHLYDQHRKRKHLLPFPFTPLVFPTRPLLLHDRAYSHLKNCPAIPWVRRWPRWRPPRGSSPV